jgi:hypothetical protein
MSSSSSSSLSSSSSSSLEKTNAVDLEEQLKTGLLLGESDGDKDTLDDAVQILGSALEQCIELHGAESALAAPYHAAYGKVLARLGKLEVDNVLEASLQKLMAKDGSDAEKASALSAMEDSGGDLEVAWECLENARGIYEAHVVENPASIGDVALPLSDVLLCLGDVQMELSMEQRAVDDLERAVALRQQVLPAHDRLLAEAYCALALVQQLAGRYSKSIVCYQAAADAVGGAIAYASAEKAKRDAAAAQQKGKEDVDDDDEKRQELDDVVELSALRDELLSKISDVKQAEKAAAKQAAAASSNAVDTDAFDAPTVTDAAQINDISSLVRRKKRTPPATNDNDDQSEGDAKKRRTE